VNFNLDLLFNMSFVNQYYFEGLTLTENFFQEFVNICISSKCVFLSSCLMPKRPSRV